MFADAGVTSVVDRPRLLRATFGNLVADGDANRAIWPFLGANAVKPCMACKNTLKLNHPALERQSYLIDVSCTTASKFDPRTNEDRWKAFDDLDAAQGVLRKKKRTLNNLRRPVAYVSILTTCLQARH